MGSPSQCRRRCPGTCEARAAGRSLGRTYRYGCAALGAFAPSSENDPCAAERTEIHAVIETTARSEDPVRFHHSYPRARSRPRAAGAVFSRRCPGAAVRCGRDRDEHSVGVSGARGRGQRRRPRHRRGDRSRVRRLRSPARRLALRKRWCSSRKSATLCASGSEPSRPRSRCSKSTSRAFPSS